MKNGLIKGDTFTAKVAAIYDNEVLLILSDGSRFMAKAKNTDGLVKGQHVSFTVEANENGQTFVRMSRAGDEDFHFDTKA